MVPHRRPWGRQAAGRVAAVTGERSALASLGRSFAKRCLSRLPVRGRRRLRRWLRGPIRFGSFRRLSPLNRFYGFSRGLPLDRYYIESFLSRFSAQPGYAAGAIQGRVLEIGGREYADRYGLPSDAPAPGRVHRVDVLHASPANPEATLVGSLTDEGSLPRDAFDCIICTQTLHVIFDTRAALRTLHGALKPGGTLLLSVPGITRSCVPDRDAWGDWWRFTSSSVRRLLEAEFPADQVYVEAYGNVLTAAGFLYGLAAEDLRPAELDSRDRDFEVVVTARAIKL
jgi:SAM-dependent methyltransferase